MFDVQSRLMGRRFAALLLTGALAMGASAMTNVAEAGATDGTRLTVIVAPSVHVRGGQVTLGEIAELVGPPAKVVAASGLDIALPDVPQDESIVSRDYLRFRLLLAGFAAEDLEILGSDSCRLVLRVRAPKFSDADVETAARKRLGETLGIEEDQLMVQLVRPFFSGWAEGLELERVDRLEVVPALRSNLGRMTLNVRLMSGTEIVASRPAVLDVAQKVRVLVSVASLNPGIALTDGMYREEERFVTQAVDELTVDQVEGKAVRTPVRPGQILMLNQLVESREEPGEILVRSREFVRLTARTKTLRLVLNNAEALQSGRLGEVIRVRNVQSNKVVAGKVVGRGVVEVPTQ